MAVFLIPVAVALIAETPTAVFVATLPPPLPTVNPFMLASNVERKVPWTSKRNPASVNPPTTAFPVAK